MKDDATAPGLPPSRRRRRRADAARLSRGDRSLVGAMDEHLERCFPGVEGMVLHETVSPAVHLDVMVVPPTRTYPCLRLVTCGMAEQPMRVPPGWPDTRYAELTIALPPGWPVSIAALRDERFFWPIRLLKHLGRMPHTGDTFLWNGHTIQNHGSEPYAPDTKLCGSLIVPPLTAPPGFEEFAVDGRRSVRILGVLPLFAEEMEMKVRHGLDALWDVIGASELTDVVDPHRPNLAA